MEANHPVFPKVIPPLDPDPDPGPEMNLDLNMETDLYQHQIPDYMGAFAGGPESNTLTTEVGGVRKSLLNTTRRNPINIPGSIEVSTVTKVVEKNKIPNYPINATDKSRNMRNTVIFKQIRTDMGSGEVEGPSAVAQVLTLDPLGIARSMNNILPDDIADVRINRRNIVAVEVSVPSEANMQKLLSITQMGKMLGSGLHTQK